MLKLVDAMNVDAETVEKGKEIFKIACHIPDTYTIDLCFLPDRDVSLKKYKNVYELHGVYYHNGSKIWINDGDLSILTKPYWNPYLYICNDVINRTYFALPYTNSC